MEIASGLCPSCKNIATCQDKMSDVLNCTTYVNDPARRTREQLLQRIAELEHENETLRENPKRKPGRPRKNEQ